MVAGQLLPSSLTLKVSALPQPPVPLVAALAAASAAVRLLKQVAIAPLLRLGTASWCRVITCVQLETLPAQSVAVQVRVITLVQVLAGLLPVSTTVRSVPQASLAVTVATGGTSATQWTSASPAQPLNTGAVVKMVAV